MIILMAPHLVRAQSAYKGIWIHSLHHKHTHRCMHAQTQIHTRHTHTTNTCIIGNGLVPKAIDQYAEQKRWVFNF